MVYKCVLKKELYHRSEHHHHNHRIIYPNPANDQPYYGYRPQSSVTEHSSTLSKKSDEKEILDGIPFEINPKYLTNNRNGYNDSTGFDSFQILSPYEIEQHFNYDFNLERANLNL